MKTKEELEEYDDYLSDNREILDYWFDCDIDTNGQSISNHFKYKNTCFTVRVHIKEDMTHGEYEEYLLDEIRFEKALIDDSELN